jgi:hypothetical protein
MNVRGTYVSAQVPQGGHAGPPLLNKAFELGGMIWITVGMTWSAM